MIKLAPLGSYEQANEVFSRFCWFFNINVTPLQSEPFFPFFTTTVKVLEGLNPQALRMNY